MIWPPAVYQLAEMFSAGDPRPVAKWPEGLVLATLAYSEWKAIQEEKALERAKQDAEIDAARAEAASKSGKNPPVPKK